MKPGASKRQSTAVETRGAGASLAPGAQPGLPQMVVMVGAQNNGIAYDSAENFGGRCIEANKERRC